MIEKIREHVVKNAKREMILKPKAHPDKQEMKRGPKNKK